MTYYCVENLLNPETLGVAITVNWDLCGWKDVCMHMHLIEEINMVCVFGLGVFHGGEMCEEVQCLDFRINFML